MRRRYLAEEKEAAVRRVAAGEAVTSVARAVGADRKRLYEWYRKYQEGGAAALQARGRPRKEAALNARARRGGRDEVAALRRQVAEQQRKIGEQEVDLDFFRRALRQLEEARRPTA